MTPIRSRLLLPLDWRLLAATKKVVYCSPCDHTVGQLSRRMTPNDRPAGTYSQRPAVALGTADYAITTLFSDRA